MGGYRELFDASVADPTEFWAQAARAVSWTRAPQRILDDTNPPFYRWFPDAELNTCANALDRHIDERGDQAALIYDSPVTGTKRTFTYRELLDETARFAGVLRGLGVGKGDRVVLYMPMIPEAVIAMLACARLGAVHSVVFGGFAAHELATRIDDAQPAVIVSASCGIEPTRVVEYKPMLDHALELASHKPAACVIVQRDRHRCDLVDGRDVEWAEVMASAHAGRPGTGGRHRSALRALHLRHDGQAQGHRPRQRRPRGRAAVEHAAHLRHRPGRRVLGGLRRRVGGRPLLHRLRTAAGRRHDGALRGKAHRHTGSRCVLAGRRRARGEGVVHRADGDPGDPQGGSGGLAYRPLRPVRAEVPVPGRRAAGPGHLRVGVGEARRPGCRPLVADRDRLGDRGQSDGGATPSAQGRLAHGADARLRRADPAGRRLAVRAGRGGRDLHQPAAAARNPADAVGRRRPLSRRRTCASTPAST